MGEVIPLAALTGILVVVVVKTFKWGSVRDIVLRRMPIVDLRPATHSVLKELVNEGGGWIVLRRFLVLKSVFRSVTVAKPLAYSRIGFKKVSRDTARLAFNACKGLRD